MRGPIARVKERFGGTRLIVDRERRLGAESGSVPYDVSARKEEVAREFVFSRPSRAPTSRKRKPSPGRENTNSLATSSLRAETS